MLRHYLANHWTPNAPGLLFPNRKGTRPRSRDNVVKYGLHSASQGVGDTDEGCRVARLQARPSDRTSGRVCTAASPTDADASRGHAYHVASLFPCHLQDPSGRHGKPRPAVNWNKCSNWNRTECLTCLFPISWRKRVGVEPTTRLAKNRITGFEGREDHRTLCASAGCKTFSLQSLVNVRNLRSFDNWLRC